MPVKRFPVNGYVSSFKQGEQGGGLARVLPFFLREQNGDTKRTQRLRVR